MDELPNQREEQENCKFWLQCRAKRCKMNINKG